jgi:2-polyprenyl-3-methyl-5-hydroxy-6-metoxy-1,4-benzoquinol methylase
VHGRGCEVSAYVVEYATGVLKLDVVCSDFRQVALPHPSFDVVTAFNSFEHLPQPRSVVRRIHKILRPGGLLLIKTWIYRAKMAIGPCPMTSPPS